MDEQRLQKAKELLKLASDSLTREDFVASFRNVVAFVTKIGEQNSKDIQAIKKELTQINEELKADTKADLQEQKELTTKQIEDLMNKMMLEHDAMMSEADAKLDKLEDGEDGRNGVDGTNGKDGKDGSPDTAEQVRDKLESLQDDDRLDASAIKGLEKYDKDIGDLKKRPLTAGFAGVGLNVNGTYIGQVHDLIVTGSAVSTTVVNGQVQLVITGGSGTTAVEAPTSGNVDGSNLVFVFTHTPTYLIVDGVSKIEGVHYTRVGATVTMNSDDIPTQFIRSVYSA